MLFLLICLQHQNFNYAKTLCSVEINDNYMAIIENLLLKGTHPQVYGILHMWQGMLPFKDVLYERKFVIKMLTTRFEPWTSGLAA